MSIGYAFITIDVLRRKPLMEAARRRLNEAGLEEVTGIEFVNAHMPGELDAALATSPYKVASGGFHKGELALWLSTVNCLREAAASEHDWFLVLEDDAVVTPSFESMLPWVLGHIPDDADFFAWAIPENQKLDYHYHRYFDDNGNWELISQGRLATHESPHWIGDELVCKAYQGYRAVAIMYTKKGALRVLDILDQKGFFGPTDLVLFQEHHAGRLNGYTLMPDITDAITHKETGTTVRSTGMYYE